MDFANGQIYHVFNRGNYSRTVFFNRRNHLFFLTKVNEYFKPYARILSWCLMPTHFHFMIEVNNERIVILDSEENDTIEETDRMTTSRPISPSKIKTPRYRTLNNSIAIMLRSYTRAINIEQNKHGSLFQQHSKDVCLTQPEFAPAYFQSHFGPIGNISNPEKEYPHICFNYIHYNPVAAGLVKKPDDWEFSSYCDYYAGRKGKLINRELTDELGFLKAEYD